MMNKIFRNLFPLILTGLLACQSTTTPEVISVLGTIPASEMGITLQHEHILVDFIGADSTGYHRWDKQEVFEMALPFLEELSKLGCKTLFECSPEYLGRDPELLRMLSEASGLNLITNTGLYGAMNDKFIPERAFRMSAEELAEEWISEFRNGIDDTGIRPGFIKIAVDPDDSLSDIDNKLIRAAGLTHLETGLVIMSHTGQDKPAFNQLTVLEEIGVSPGAFIWTHANRGTAEGRIRAAKMGAWISLDKVSTGTIGNHVKYLLEMKDAGLLEHALISHDSGWYHAGEENGGKFNGYTSIFKELIPALKENGFTESEIRQLLVLNPANAMSIRIVHPDSSK